MMDFREIVKRRKKDLAKSTLVSDDLLSALELEDLIKDSVRNKIKALGGNEPMANELYKIVGTTWTDDNIKSLITILRQCSNPVAANILEKKEQGFRKFAWNVISPVNYFVGRREEKKQFHDFLTSTDSILVIHGFGGQGKSQLCRQCVRDLEYDENFNSAFVFLQGESRQTFLSSILSFAKTVDPSLNQYSQMHEILDQIKKELNENLVWILDNVDTYPEVVKTFCQEIVKLRPKDKLIVTSRLKTIFPRSAETILVSQLSDKDAKQFVRACLQMEEDDEIKSLCERMGNHALALHLALGCIKFQKKMSLKGNKYSIKDFLKAYNKSKELVLNQEDEMKVYERTVFRNVQTSLDFISEGRKEILKKVATLLSLCRHDGIEFRFFVALVRGVGVSETEMKDSVQALKSVSLLESEDEVITIHPLVQETIRLLYPDWKDLAKRLFESVDLVFDNTFPNIFKIYISIWDVLCQQNSLYQERIECLEKIYSSLKTSSTILSTRFSFTERLKDNLAILPDCEEAGMEKNGKPNHTIHDLQTNTKEILTQIIKELEKPGKIFTNNPEIVLDWAEECAQAYELLGNLEKAEEIFGELLKEFCTNEKLCARIKQNLALLYRSCGKEARLLLVEVLNWREAHLEKTDLDLLTTRLNIGICLLYENRFMDAQTTFLAITKSHNSARENVNPWLALSLIKMEKYAEAVEILDDVLKHLGPYNPLRTISMRNRAYCNKKLGENQKANEEMKEVEWLEVLIRDRENKMAKSFLTSFKATFKMFESAKFPLHEDGWNEICTVTEDSSSQNYLSFFSRLFSSETFVNGSDKSIGEKEKYFILVDNCPEKKWHEFDRKAVGDFLSHMGLYEPSYETAKIFWLFTMQGLLFAYLGIMYKFGVFQGKL